MIVEDWTLDEFNYFGQSILLTSNLYNDPAVSYIVNRKDALCATICFSKSHRSLTLRHKCIMFEIASLCAWQLAHYRKGIVMRYFGITEN